mgnify:CR=1 FL=1
MAKAACESLTINLAMELAPLGIRVNCIKPGPIVTPFWDELFPPEEKEAMEAAFHGIATREVPLNRMGTPDDIAGPALFSGLLIYRAYITGPAALCGAEVWDTSMPTDSLRFWATYPLRGKSERTPHNI